MIAGREAWLTTWSDTRIVAFVPEEAPLGTVPVQVLTDAGASNAVALEVTARQSNGRVAWTFEADFDNLWYRPALAPDGTICLHGSESFVYALTPDGGLEWTAQVSWYPYVPPSAASDGTLYLGSIQSVFALSPADGSPIWQYEISSAT